MKLFFISISLANDNNDGFHTPKDIQFRPPVIFPSPLSTTTDTSKEETEEEGNCRDFLKASSRLLQQNVNENIAAGKWKPLQEVRQTSLHISTTQTLLPVNSITQSASLSSIVVDRKGLVEPDPACHVPREDFANIIPPSKSKNMVVDEKQIIRSLHLDFIQRTQQVSSRQSDDTLIRNLASPISSSNTVSSLLSEHNRRGDHTAINNSDNISLVKGKRGRKRKPHPDNIIEPAKHKRPQQQQQQQHNSKPQQQPHKSPFKITSEAKPSTRNLDKSPTTNLDILKQAALANLPDTTNNDITYRPLSMTEPSSKKKKSRKTEGRPTTTASSVIVQGKPPASSVIMQGKSPFAVMSAPLHNRILVQNSGQRQTLTLGQQQLIIPSASYTANLLQQSSLPIMFAPPKSHHFVTGANKSLVVQHPTIAHAPSHQQFMKVFPEQLPAPFYRPNAPMIVISTPSVMVDNAQPSSTKASPTFPPPK